MGKEHASHTFILLTFIQAWVLRQNEKQKSYGQKQNACLNFFKAAFELLLYRKYGNKFKPFS